MKRSYYLKRIIPCALVILVCLFIVIMSIEAVGFTDEQRMRLAEKAQLVGPSNIIGRENGLPVWGDVLIGQSRYGYTLYACHNRELFYHKKTEAFTTFSPIHLPDEFVTQGQPIPVFVFSDEADAVHAKLTATVYNTFSGALMSYPFSADAVRNENGYFLFELSLDDLADDYFCSVLTEMLNNLYCSWPLTYGTITLELYSEKGDLLETFTRNYYVSETESIQLPLA